MRNYHYAFIEATTNTRTMAFKPIADMHAHSMVLFKKQHARDITEYSPIAAALLHLQMIDKTMQARMKHKLDILYMIAKENMSFTKMKAVRRATRCRSRQRLQKQLWLLCFCRVYRW